MEAIRERDESVIYLKQKNRAVRGFFYYQLLLPELFPEFELFELSL